MDEQQRDPGTTAPSTGSGTSTSTSTSTSTGTSTGSGTGSGISTSDRSLLQRITDLVDEENRLRAETERPEQHADRIQALEEELDQLWDLLRQRRARREFGDDPDGARMRDRDTVERYLN